MLVMLRIQPHPRPRHDFARHLRRLRHPFSACCLASRWKEYMAFLRSFYVADDMAARAYAGAPGPGAAYTRSRVVAQVRAGPTQHAQVEP